MMTRKDYVEVSEILKLYREDMGRARFEDLVLDFASMFSEDNPRFSVSRFEEACYSN